MNALGRLAYNALVKLERDDDDATKAVVSISTETEISHELGPLQNPGMA